MFKIIIAFLFTVLSSNLYAAQWAFVKTAKAVVYTDQQLTSPIGHIVYGKKIRVGEVQRKHNTVLPIVVSGRICYIQTKDIILEKFINNEDGKTPRISEHRFVNEEYSFMEDFAKDNFILFGYESYSLGSEFEELTSFLGESLSPQAHTYKFQVEHRPNTKRFSFGIGLAYTSAKGEDVSLKMTTFHSDFFYSLIKSKKYTLDALAGAWLSGDLTIKSASTVSRQKGIVFGQQLGMAFKILPYGKYGVTLGATLKRAQISKLENIEQSDGSTLSLNAITGANLFAHLNIKI